MTDTTTTQRSDASVGPPSTRSGEICLATSFVLSGLAILTGIIVMFQIASNNARFRNEARGQYVDLFGPWPNNGDRPIYVFLLLVVGVAALTLAFIGAKSAYNRWPGVLAGAMATSVLMVPILMIASRFLSGVLGGGFGNGGGD